jgi:hypothetical protein
MTARRQSQSEIAGKLSTLATGYHPTMTSEYAHPWDLDPAIAFLDYGSYGATPRGCCQNSRRGERAWSASLRSSWDVKRAL